MLIREIRVPLYCITYGSEWVLLSALVRQIRKNDVDCLQGFPGRRRVAAEFRLSAVKWFHYLVDRERPDQSKVDQAQRYSVPGDWNLFLAAAVAAIS